MDTNGKLVIPKDMNTYRAVLFTLYVLPLVNLALRLEGNYNE